MVSGHVEAALILTEKASAIGKYRQSSTLLYFKLRVFLLTLNLLKIYNSLGQKFSYRIKLFSNDMSDFTLFCFFLSLTCGVAGP